jgi:adhesin HecA-like repeat protein
MAKTAFYVNERATARYTATIKNEAGTAISSSSIDAATLTLKDASGAVINSRNAQNILNTNGVTISAAGALVWTVASADNAMSSTSGHETHTATFNIVHATTGGAGAKRITHVIDIIVRQLADITT